MIEPVFQLGAAAAAALAATAWVSFKVVRRLELSLAKHPSLTGHVRWAKRLTGQLPGYAYDEQMFFASDGAGALLVARRKAGFSRLSAAYSTRFAETLASTGRARAMLSDLQFTAAYRVPFQYSDHLRRHIGVGAFLRASDGVMVEDLDGNLLFDLTGSYGMNLFGYDFYKDCIDEGARTAHRLGPVLGAYHPCMLYNLKRLRDISGQDCAWPTCRASGPSATRSLRATTGCCSSTCGSTAWRSAGSAPAG